LTDMGANWLSTTQPILDQSGAIQSVTLTFNANSDTAYWVWNLTDTEDLRYCTVDVNITNFTGDGTSYAIYSDISVATLEWMPDVIKANDIDFLWDGIDDTNMDIWYPVDEQYPMAGDDYEMAFEPSEGYVMSETITVMIDGVEYIVYTDGSGYEDEIAPNYDPESNILKIPGELLTEETQTVAIVASAVEVVNVAVKSPTADTVEIPVIFDLENVASPSNATMKAGDDYHVALNPEDGYELPECIYVEIDDASYEIYTDGEEHREIEDGESELALIPTFNPTSNKLTIPLALFDETTESVIVAVYAVEIEEEEGAEKEESEGTDTESEEIEEEIEETDTESEETEEETEETDTESEGTEEEVEETDTEFEGTEEEAEETDTESIGTEEETEETDTESEGTEKVETDANGPEGEKEGTDVEEIDSLLLKDDDEEEEQSSESQENSDETDDVTN